MSEPVFFFLIVGRSLKPFPQSDQEGTSDVVYRPHSPPGGYEDPHAESAFFTQSLRLRISSGGKRILRFFILVA